jgi:DsbC/DsbD-like thiol-disulfide interchange protein
MTVTRTGKTHTAQKHSGRIGTMAVMLAMAAATGLAGAAPAAALSVSRAELVSGTGTVRAGEPFWLAVHIQLDDGWHTYWRNPGDSGASPLINWQLPPGIEPEPAVWPYPPVSQTGLAPVERRTRTHTRIGFTAGSDTRRVCNDGKN